MPCVHIVDSNWTRRHGTGNFDKPRIPFGCLVDFKQQPSKDQAMPKAAPDTIPGIYLGTRLNPGDKFTGEAIVAPLYGFKELDFSLWGSTRGIF